ncbi:dihydroorotase [Hydrogenophaga sp.]|uniref:dihydroorotase n=1 Tax=Hydrogenophaga sp. TaxID=1904254 RepID=UPI0019C5CBAC|nr:dihydroorotase [Hydrogenophaga sp.]MBD3893488.1 dihydroorotase [Hydrogenophaga sp.]
MKILIQNGRLIDPASGRDEPADVAIAAGRIVAIGRIGAEFQPNRRIDASGCVVAPGLLDLAVRLREPGQEHAGMLESETAAAVAGAVTTLVCPPDTDPVLDEPGLVDMLKFRAERLQRARVCPLGALTRGLKGEVLTEMVELTESGCIGFGQAEQPIVNTQVLQRALQYAATFGYTLWLRPQDHWLGQGVAASGALATRMGLSGIPVAAETIALHTLFELMRALQGQTAGGAGVRVHLCRLSSAAGLQLVRQAKADGLPVTCDVSVHNLHLSDVDLGYFDSRLRLQPPLRQPRDRDALRAGLADGSIDALVSDHNPVGSDAKTQPFALAEPGATAVELLLGLCVKWAQQDRVSLMQALRVLSSGARAVLGTRLGTLPASVGALVPGGAADVCVFDLDAPWVVQPAALRSQGKHTPFAGHELPLTVCATLVGGQLTHLAPGWPRVHTA